MNIVVILINTKKKNLKLLFSFIKMDVTKLLDKCLNYKTKYFDSFSEFIYNYNIKNNLFINILCCNIKVLI